MSFRPDHKQTVTGHSMDWLGPLSIQTNLQLTPLEPTASRHERIEFAALAARLAWNRCNYRTRATLTCFSFNRAGCQRSHSSPLSAPPTPWPNRGVGGADNGEECER